MSRTTPAKVAIGLPVRNGERYLALAIQSILGQTFEDFELIVSDNASTDRTEEITREFMHTDPRVLYRRNDTNVGVAENFNRSFRGTKSTYYRWAAYDDVIEPTYLQRCVDLLDSHPDVVIAHTYSNYIDADGLVTRPNQPAMLSQMPRPSDRFKGALHHREVDGVWGLMRAEVVRKTRLHGRYSGSDFAFLADVYLRGRLAYVPECLFSIREHPAAYTGRGATMSLKEKWEWWGQTGLMKSKYLHAPLLTAYAADAVVRSNVSWGEKLRCWKCIGGSFGQYFGGIGGRWGGRLRRLLPRRSVQTNHRVSGTTAD